MTEKTLVITGMGAVTPIGIGVAAYWEALKAGRCGVGPITRFDASGLPVQIAAELKGFAPVDHMPKALARTMDPFMQFAFAAAQEALVNSGRWVSGGPGGLGRVGGTAVEGGAAGARTGARS